MKLVINASPLIFLTKLDLIDHIIHLFEVVIIPNGVKEEILKQEDKASEWINSSKKSKIDIEKIDEIPSFIKAWDLGKGESEVIAFAKKHEQFITALDDRAARNCANSLRIKVIGTLGLILFAKNKGIISNASEYLHKLRQLGYRIDDETYEYVLYLANE